jgi:hypothetical protein
VALGAWRICRGLENCGDLVAEGVMGVGRVTGAFCLGIAGTTGGMSSSSR